MHSSSATSLSGNNPSATSDAKTASVGRALKRLGIPRDGVLMVHSAFRQFGRDGYQMASVLDVLMDYMAPGTLLLPTMSWRFVKPNNPFFDEQATPSNVGALTELFRTRYATHRSLHPTHSGAALGRAAADITGEHHLEATPCGDRSPFGKLVAHDGWVVMFGISMDCCTLVHHVEEKVAIDLYLKPESETETYTCRRRSGEEVAVRLRRHLFLPRDYYQFQDMLAVEGKLAVTTLDTSILRAFRARDLVALTEKTLKARPDAIIARPGQRYRRM